MSRKYNGLSIDLYSAASFRHSNISKNVSRIYVSSARNIDVSHKMIFINFGMTVHQKENEYVLKVIDGHLDSYCDFISYANKKRNEYIELEKEYFTKVSSLDANWIAGEFRPLKGVHKKAAALIQQQYDCLSFVVYLQILNMQQEERDWG